MMITQNQVIHDEERLDLPSASASARRILCPGSHKQSIGKQEILSPEMQAWRDEGNQIHAWLAVWLGRRLGLGVGTAPVDAPQFDVESDAGYIAERCIEQTRTLIHRVFMDCGGSDAAFASLRLIQEQRMWLYWAGTHTSANSAKRFSGKADAIFLLRDPDGLYTCLIIDFKTNRGDIEDSPRNPQLRDLAVLLWLTLGGKVRSIHVAIVQPLLKSEPDLCEYDVSSLHIAHNMLLNSLAESEMPDPPLRPGHVQCKFCPAKLSCRALKALRDSINPDITGLSPEELAAWLDRAEPIVQAYDSALNAARAHLNMDPASVPRWQLEPNSPFRVIQNPKLAHDTLVAEGYIDTDTFLAEACEVTIDRLSKALVKRNNLKPKRLADAIINRVCAPAVTMHQKNPSLTRK